MKQRHQQAFDEMMIRFGLSAKVLAAESGVSEVQLSRFRNGKQDLYAGALVETLSKTPEEAQEFYLGAVLGKKVQPNLDVRALVQQMSSFQRAQLLCAIAECLDSNPNEARDLTLQRAS